MSASEPEPIITDDDKKMDSDIDETSDTDQAVRQMDRNVMIVRDPERLR